MHPDTRVTLPRHCSDTARHCSDSHCSTLRHSDTAGLNGIPVAPPTLVRRVSLLTARYMYHYYGAFACPLQSSATSAAVRGLSCTTVPPARVRVTRSPPVSTLVHIDGGGPNQRGISRAAILWGHVLENHCRDPPHDCGRFHAQEPPRDPPVVDLRPLLPYWRVRHPSGPSRGCFGCGQRHPSGTSMTSLPHGAPAA